MSGEFTYNTKATMNILPKEKHPAWPSFIRFLERERISFEDEIWLQLWNAFKTGYTVAESVWR